MSNQLKMTTERLVDVFEQMLGVAHELTCKKKKGEYAACIKRMKSEGLENKEMSLGRMCVPCRALWHLQLGKDDWVEVAKSLNRGWDPVEMIPDEDREPLSPQHRADGHG